MMFVTESAAGEAVDAITSASPSIIASTPVPSGPTQVAFVPSVGEVLVGEASGAEVVAIGS